MPVSLGPGGIAVVQVHRQIATLQLGACNLRCPSLPSRGAHGGFCDGRAGDAEAAAGRGLTRAAGGGAAGASSAEIAAGGGCRGAGGCAAAVTCDLDEQQKVFTFGELRSVVG